MSLASLQRLLALANLALIALVIVRWRAAASPPPSVDIVPPGLHRRSVNVTFDEDSLASAADVVVDGDPFRIANAPTSVAYAPTTDGPQQIGAAIVAPVRVPHPVLVLRAIVGGPPWQAIVDGLPGEPPGTIVNAGMIVSSLKIRSVSRDTVLVQGTDTTWRLTLGRSQP
jgi:hypothetical protein